MPLATPPAVFTASNHVVTVSEREVAPGLSRLVFQRHDHPAASFEVSIGWISRDGTQVHVGGFVRDASLGQTYALLRREADGRIVRWWIAPGSPLVYAVPWAEVNTRYTVPVEMIVVVPLDDRYPQPEQLVRRFDGDPRILAYDAAREQWRHVPDLATFQARGYYWCNVNAADAEMYARLRLGPPYPTSAVPARADYPNCRS